MKTNIQMLYAVAGKNEYKDVLLIAKSLDKNMNDFEEAMIELSEQNQKEE